MATRITNNLPRFIEQMHVKAARAMTQALILGQSESSMMTPIDTSVLLNSQIKSVESKAGRIVGTAGYTAEYALAVHDQDNPQNFRRAGAEKSFLSKGFEQAEPNIRGVLTGAIKV